MASNHTDWAFGEQRGNSRNYEVYSMETTAAVMSGDSFTITGSRDDDVFQGRKAAGNEHVVGIVAAGGKNGAYKANSMVPVITRGLTRPRTTASNTIALLGAIALVGGKFVIESASGAGPAFAQNVGGALADGDTGLVYMNGFGGAAIPQ